MTAGRSKRVKKRRQTPPPNGQAGPVNKSKTAAEGSNGLERELSNLAITAGEASSNSGRAREQDSPDLVTSGETTTVSTDPSTPLLGIRWRTGRCFKTRVPRTLVNGVPHDHVPLDESLPQPLKHGLIEWARCLKNRPRSQGPGSLPIPPSEAENKYLHRTLRFWKLSTDYSRFMNITNESRRPNEGTDNVNETAIDDDEIYEDVGGGVLVRAPARRTNSANQENAEEQELLYWSSIQRPYTAPPHQFAPSLTATTTVATERRRS